MKVLHFEKNYQYDDRDLLTVARKIGKLATYCKSVKDESSSIRVDTECRNTKKERDAVKVCVTVELPFKTLRAESRKPTVMDALDRCVEKLEPQVKRYKDRLTRKNARRRK